MSRVTPFSHTPTPAGEISRPRTQAVLNARVRLPGDRGVREWASSPKARERTCFLSSFRPCASLSACGARSARERAWRRRNPRAFGRDTARATQPARIIAPHRAAPCKLIGFLRAVPGSDVILTHRERGSVRFCSLHSPTLLADGPWLEVSAETVPQSESLAYMQFACS